jgi:hypothetical protein
LDIGKDYKVASVWKYNCLVDDKGMDIRFRSPMDALDYLGRQGWELVSYGNETEDSRETYLLKKETTGMSDEQVEKFLSQYHSGDAKNAKGQRKLLDH